VVQADLARKDLRGPQAGRPASLLHVHSIAGIGHVEPLRSRDGAALLHCGGRHGGLLTDNGGAARAYLGSK
jgi:hypothetical protein